MIKKWHCFGQKIAVGKHEYIDIIEGSLVSIKLLVSLYP
jgi:hypothetical protein